MRVVTIILIVVALAVAGTVAFLVNSWLAQTEAESRKPPEIIEEAKVEVLVAATDLPIGKIIRSEDLRWQSWPEDSIGPDYVVRGMAAESADGGEEGEARASIDDIEGAAVRVEIIAGEPILAYKLFHRGESGFLSGVLAPGMRAITISVNPETGSAGFVLPGDHVDLVVVFDVLDNDQITGDTTSRTISETILENVRVLATDQSVAARTKPGEGGEGDETLADLAETVTLEVTPNQAQAVAVADALGSIRLILRSAIEGELSENRNRYSPDYAVSAFLGRRVPDSARILVANRDIAPGTVLTDRDWFWLDMPAELIERNWIREGSFDLTNLRGALSPAGLDAGQPLVPERLILAGQDGYITSLLSPGMRAIAINLDETRTVSAFIRPDDRVDLIFDYETTVEWNDPEFEPFFVKDPRRFSEVLMEDIRVLYIDRNFNEDTGLPALDGLGTVTLEVTPEQAEKIILATREGSLSLVLRGNEPGSDTRLADYTSDFEMNRSFIELMYGLTMPEPPASVAEQGAIIDLAPADGTGDLGGETLHLSDYLDGLSAGGSSDAPAAGDSSRSDGQVRVYRGTQPQDLDFSSQ
ncbi:MAG: Flp pilus assembly protein CpaB [Proteobacteria bacterium]|nr:Flp pilus assembly protein CpaB [Pseudomonadota bacterium]